MESGKDFEFTQNSISNTFKFKQIFREQMLFGSPFQASSFSDFLDHLSITWSCLWTDSGVCSHVTGRLWIISLATSLVILTQLLVISSSDGAVYLSMLAVLTIPLGTLFWTLWKDTLSGSLVWNPDITVPSVFALVGMLILLPAMIIYEYLGMQEKYDEV